MRFLLKFRLFLMILGVLLLTYVHHWMNFGQAFQISQIVGFSCFILANIFAWLGIWYYRADFVEERRCWFWIYCWQKLILIGFALLYLQRYWAPGFFIDNPMWAKVCVGAWGVCLITGFCAGLTTEWANFGRGRESFADSNQPRAAFIGGLSIGMLLSIIVCVNFIASQRDKSYDVSYLKTAAVGEGTAKGLERLTETLDILLFFPATNEVRPFAVQYFEQLAAMSNKVRLQYLDKDLNPTESAKYDVTTNGQVVLVYGNQTARIKLGLTLELARKYLRTLDHEFQKTLIDLTTSDKVAYFTRGHDELTFDNVSEDAKVSMKAAAHLWRAQNYNLRLFGIAEGAANEVPADATVVVIVAPQKPFLANEVKVLRDYVNKGGSLLVFLDPRKASVDPKTDPLMELLNEFGVTFNNGVVADMKKYVRGSRTELDHWLLFSNLFSSHEAVLSLARDPQRRAVLYFEAGTLTLREESPTWHQFDLMKTYSTSFIDANANFKQDSKEPLGTFIIASAGQWQKGDGSKTSRVIVFADSTWTSDLLMPNPANQQLLTDSMKWLAGLEDMIGSSSNEDDIPLIHSNEADAVLFNSTIAGVPFLLLVIGYVMTRRPQRVSARARREHEAST